jgi:hypothetical protein
VKYLPPFELIRRSVEITSTRGELRINMSYEEFVRILKSMLAGVEIDEEWYLNTYEDIRQAVKEGTVPSARQHFISDGYFEGRRPFPIVVDEAWYLAQYPDVKESVREGSVASAQAHFDEDGLQEGRLPFGI